MIKTKSIVAAFVLTFSSYQCQSVPPQAVTIQQVVDLFGSSLQEQINTILKQNVPRLTFTGLAFATGIAGAATTYHALNDPTEKQKLFSNKTQLGFGLGMTSLSIVSMYLLWRK